MNEHDEYWQKEFQSLSEEDNDPIQMKSRKYSTTLLLVWSIFFNSIVTLAIISSLLFRQGIFYWSPSIIIQGLSFYGTVYVLLSILYILERGNGMAPRMT